MTENAAARYEAMRDRLAGLVEAELTAAALAQQTAALLSDTAMREQAGALLRDLRDLLDRASAEAETDLQTWRAERGIHPDD
ncbi:hypothetical protein [Rhodospirillum centenum]|uniref:Uncharacterized protein n=1 Tax=Rhodospirillum centenum (strain ATCC 51521 / SW) TaxID=414684 RepID=B6IQJ0_RHOCS|nr:hypothetical protein [Rhodospirillum centenum]ACI97726.1 hypothetical protein RC1_0277 [Rhodospirillum centenum SW]